MTRSRDDVIEFIEQHLPVRKAAKDKNGEVFTPLQLVNDMLDALPKHVWSNPRLRWLDPACGVGNFPVVVFYRLDDGLRKKIPDTQKRRHHIVRNMLYMVELDDRNYKVAREVFGDDANIFHGSFLDDGWRKAFGGVANAYAYDVVVGNPPYNQGGTRIGGNVFWKQFVFGALGVLAPGGYLCFVHPPGWRKMTKDRASAGDIWERFNRDGHLVYLNMDNSPRYKANGFPTVDFYVWQHTKPVENGRDDSLTHVEAKFDKLCYDGELDLSSLPFIPSYVNPAVVSIIRKLERVPKEDRMTVVHSQAFKASSKDTHKNRVGPAYAHVYDHAKGEYTKAYRARTRTRTQGKRRGSDKLDGLMSHPKVVMTFNGAKENGCLYPVYYDGSAGIGTTASAMYQLVSGKKEGERLVKFLNSDLVRALLKITQYSDRPNHKNEFYVLNMLPLDVDRSRNVLGRLGLSKDEMTTVSEIAGKGSCTSNVVEN